MASSLTSPLTSVTINAELLDDKDAFSYRDIQKLCCKLNLGGKGKREELVAKLKSWHRSRSPASVKSSQSSPSVGTAAMPMNVIGQRFCMLAVNVSSKKMPGSAEKCAESGTFVKGKKRRASLVGTHDEPEVVSPRLLKPLESKNDLLSPKSAMKSRLVRIGSSSYLLQKP